MKKIAREIRKNVYRVFHEPTSNDYAAVIVTAMAVGLCILALVK